ncbi:hypothetical protein AAFF_G00074260 [Aldrovandia affinis]|uniref:Uncharacterized protein n=1 Tax=Aldrovandia affinis TaxID=143900 RepID=A0AAD7WDB7_9TELE|nr:hypothetical protein AAFF_G00074260 [Aldrovandia affinis]
MTDTQTSGGPVPHPRQMGQLSTRPRARSWSSVHGYWPSLAGDCLELPGSRHGPSGSPASCCQTLWGRLLLGHLLLGWLEQHQRVEQGNGISS